MGWIYRFVRALLRAALYFYFTEIEVRGRENLPDGIPLLMCANHHNGMIDPFLLIAASDRPVRFVAKAPLFKVPILGFFMRRMGCIPAYRHQDQGYAKEKNEQLFSAVGDALASGGVIGIFPEGRSHTDPSLAEFKQGAARMALDAESRSDFNSGLRVQLVGIHFEKTRVFRGKVLVTFAPPLPLDSYKKPFFADPKAAVQTLTEALHEKMSGMVLSTENAEILRLAEMAEQFGIVEEQESGLRGKFNRKKRILEEYERLQSSRPKEVAEIRELLRSYEQTLAAFRLRDAQITEDYRAARAAAFALTNAAMILIGTPVFILGVLLNGPPYLLAQMILLFTGGDQDVRASVGFLISLLFFPVWYAAMAWLGWRFYPLWVWLPLVATAPFFGAAAISWLTRWRRLGRAARGLLFAIRLPAVRKGLQDTRALILRKIEALIS